MSEAVLEKIKQDISSNDVVLYMKGTKVQPQCGFSAMVVQILGMNGVEFKDVDVIADPEIRATLPEYSDWPTFPQLFIKGELVGGCDIVREMQQSGELQQLLKEKGVKTAA